MVASYERWKNEDLLGGDVKPNKKYMNTSKVMLDLIKLSDLINKIELQIKNIEMGDSHLGELQWYRQFLHIHF